jgi:hypothetical protein
MIRVSVHALLAMLALTSSVSAATIDIALQDFQASGILKYTFNGGEVTNGSSGLFRFGTQNPSGLPATLLGNPEFGFCIELEQPFTSTFETYTVGDLTTANNPVSPIIGPVTVAKANLVRQLWTLFYDDSWELAPPYTNTQITDCIAFSATLYEILSDFDGVSLSSLNLDAGIFTMEGAFFLDENDPLQQFPSEARAQQYIAALSLSYNGPLANLVALTSPTYQDYIVEVIPEASSTTLVALGTLGLALGYRVGRRRSTEV